MEIKTFVFNGFQENTYIIYDENRDCAIIDPGCNSDYEQEELVAFVRDNNLKVTHLLNTHLHVDHVLGNHFVKETYGTAPQAHEGDLPMYKITREYAKQFGMVVAQDPPAVEHLFNEGDHFKVGTINIEVIHVPGHSPGGICFYIPESKIIIVGDALFSGSIGRSDLWGGDHEQLIENINSKLMVLDEQTVVYSGHGPKTSIGAEKAENPYLQ